MRRLFCILIILWVAVLHAQIQWQEDGISIRQGVNIEWFRAAATVADGSVIYVWSDTRLGDRDVYAQKMDVDGNLLWGEEGVLINGVINRQEDIVIIESGDNEVVVAWVDFRYEDAGDIFAQKLDANGNLLWDEEGVPLCLVEDVQISLNIVSDENGGAFIIWIDDRNTGGVDIYGTHILSSSDIAAGWDANGNAIANASGDQGQHTFWADGTGGAIVVWNDKREADNENLYMQRLAADGTQLWATGGTILCDAPDVQETPKMTPDGTGNFIISWRDKRNENPGDIYAQRIDLNGDFLWGDNIGICVGDGIQENPRITKASDQGAIIAWEDGRNDSFFKDIYAQKIDINGNLLWQPEGNPICIENYHQINPRLIGNDAGGCWIVWDDARGQGYPYVDIYVQKVNADGSIQFEVNGKVLCNAIGEQFSPLIKKNATNDVFVSWGDNRDGSTGIYLQTLNDDGQIQLAGNGEIIYYGLCGDANNYQFLANNDQPVIIWEDTRFGIAGTQIYCQVLNSNGTFNLDENGVPITAMTGYDQQELDATLYPGSNCIAAVWEEIREGDFNQVYAQAVDVDGNSLWNENGLPVGENLLGQQEIPQISVKEDNGELDYYIGWTDFRGGGSAIYGQKIHNGQLQWNTEGKLIADRPGNDELKDVVENFYIWRGGAWPHHDIFAKLVDENGNTAIGWPDDGIAVCTAIDKQLNPRGILIPEGIFIVWEDLRSDSLTSRDVYGQIITYDGNILWEENGKSLVSFQNDQTPYNFLYKDDALFLVWDDFRTGNLYEIYLQKFGMDGTEIWQTGGVEVADKDSTITGPYLCSVGDNSLVFWEDRLGDYSDIYAQLINANGELQWSIDGEIICDAIKNQDKPQAVTDDEDVYVIWRDMRSSGKTDIYNIYAQKLFVPLNSADDVCPQQHFVLKQNYPNPFNPETTIHFTLPNGIEKASLAIYNIKGQKVKTFEIPQSEIQNPNCVVWKGKDEQGNSVSSGDYLYQLDSKDFQSKTKKMVLMK